MQAIILAGGSGMPLRPLTARQPRSMVPVANKPLVHYQIELLRRHGVLDIIVCVDQLAEVFDRHFQDHEYPGTTIRIHRDTEPRGTAGALKGVESLLTSDEALVINGHILTNMDVTALIKFHRKNAALTTLALSSVPDPLHYGVALADTTGRIVRWVEKPSMLDEAPTDTINAGIYVIDRQVLEQIPSGVEYSLERHLLPKLVASDMPLYGLVSDAYWQDITSLPDYRQALSDILEGKADAQIGGVLEGERLWVSANTSIHPTADISGPVVIGRNVSIGRNVKIRGPVSIGANCRIGDDAVIDQSIVWRGTIIEPNATVSNCILGDDCVIKEGAAVQEGSVLGNGAVVASYLANLSTAIEAERRSRIKFGTDGWRGIIADDFTGENVRLVSQAIVNYFKEDTSPGDPLVVVGYDNRAQSDFFARQAASVVAAAGLRAVLTTEPCSSPAVSYMAKFLHARGGIMVTASHNPPSFNGLKVKAYYGGSASPAIITSIERQLHRLVDSGAAPEIVPAGLMIDERDFRPSYLGHLESLVDLDAIRDAGQKIVIDPMHGSGSGYLSSILLKAGCEGLIEIRSDRNPYFGGINPEPIMPNMQALVDAVRAHGADVGIALDGDADRVGAVDSEGRFVDCHRIFAVLLRHLVEQRGWRGGIVKTVSTTRMIDKLARKYDLPLYETPIGFKHICDLMLQEDILIGGEESGGIGVKNHIPERDGVLMGLLILEAMAKSGKRLEELIAGVMAEVGVHEYARVDMHPAPSRMHTIISTLQSFKPAEVAGQPVADVSRKDGVKVNFQDGAWLLLRPSGTEPVVRVYAEASSQERVKALLDAGIGIVDAA
ncbi:MAG: sugar phosphate nucleotidyltransferase [Capsulimonadaceae bacterium]|nr:sugar phosphate nucleotidyltransferase [Capsulimonadaceae bacterium]